METDAHSRALLNISFTVPSKGALPPGPPSWPLRQRCPIPRAFLFVGGGGGFMIEEIWYIGN
jgi:hypothetical protein